MALRRKNIPAKGAACARVVRQARACNALAEARWAVWLDGEEGRGQREKTDKTGPQGHFKAFDFYSELAKKTLGV